LIPGRRKIETTALEEAKKLTNEKPHFHA